VASQPTFSHLVSLACHDLRTPLATASGFAHTLVRLDSLAAPADRYVEMIGTASDQMAQLLDLLAVAARIEGGRFEPQARSVDVRELVDTAAGRLGQQANVEGDGQTVEVDAGWAETALAALGECVRRHGALPVVSYSVSGPEVSIGPLGEGVGQIALGEELKDLGAAVGSKVLAAMGADLSVEGDSLKIRLPQ